MTDPVTNMDDENKARMVGLLSLCPWLTEGKGRTLLYVGAMPERQDFLAELIGWGWVVDILEVWEPYHEYLRALHGVRAVYGGNILDCQELPGRYQVVFWWHGPEHMEKDKVPQALQNAEAIAEEAVILGMPFGKTDSGVTEGNTYNQHVSAWQGPDIGDLGYTWLVTTEGYRNITAVKQRRLV